MKECIDGFCVDECFVFDMYHISALEDIATENLTSHGGSLRLSFYDMLKTLHKHNITPRILMMHKANDGMIGYCMFYLHDENIHISHVCLKRKYQGQELAQRFISWLRCCKSKTITADVSYDNYKSKAFFAKMGFEFVENNEKQRWKVTLYN